MVDSMYMVMYIMIMNIYITQKNENRLRTIVAKDPEMTMSGLINRLLDKYWEGKGPDIFPEYAEDVKDKTQVFDKQTLEYKPRQLT